MSEPPPPERPPDSLRDRLRRAAEGLVYSSESDFPFEFVALPAPAGGAALTASTIAALVGAPGTAQVEERTLDRFLAPHIERSDPYDVRAQAIRPRYEALKKELRAALPDLRVFRVRRPGDAQVRCYLVGTDAPRGRLAGLTTTAVET